MTNPEERIKEAINLAIRYGQIDGDHHKMWVIDQVVRILLGDQYTAAIAECCKGDPEDEDDYYEWDVGIAP